MNEILSLIKGVAPSLATAVAGPLGGAAVSAIASRLGVSDSVEEVAKAIAGDPQAEAKIKELEAILGSQYKILASVGHIIDLPEKLLSIDIKNNYIISVYLHLIFVSLVQSYHHVFVTIQIPIFLILN